MIQRAVESLSDLYEADETAWLEAMAELIQQGRFSEIDFPHLGEYLTDMARSDRRQVTNRLTTLMVHLLKWEHQSEGRTNSWRATIVEQRRKLRNLIPAGVLRSHAESVLAGAYVDAVEQAAAETGLAAETFPAECPYSLEQVLDSRFLAQ